MNVQKGVVGEAKNELRNLFGEVGYAKKGRGFTLVHDLNQEVFGVAFVGSVTQTGDGTARLFLNIGVGHQGLESRIAALKGTAIRKYEVPSHVRNLGYVSPAKAWLEWPFVGSDMVPQTAREMFATFVRYGIPYIQQFDSLNCLYSLIEGDNSNGIFHRDYQVPVMLHMMGRSTEARTFVEEVLARWKHRTDPAVAVYSAFAGRFLESIGPS